MREINTVRGRVRQRPDRTEFEAKLLRSGQAVDDADPVPLTSTASSDSGHVAKFGRFKASCTLLS